VAVQLPARSRHSFAQIVANVTPLILRFKYSYWVHAHIRGFKANLPNFAGNLSLLLPAADLQHQ
jgi:hypothetical protein